MSHTPDTHNGVRAGWYEREGQAQWWNGSSWHEGDWQVPAGWYEVAGSARWWDGSGWTEHQRPAPPEPARVLGVQVQTAAAIAAGLAVAGAFGLLTVVHVAGPGLSMRDDAPQVEIDDPRLAGVAEFVEATCEVDQYSDQIQTCLKPATGSGIIMYAVAPTQGQAEGVVARWDDICSEYAIVEMSDDQYAVVSASEAGGLAPLTAQYDITVYAN